MNGNEFSVGFIKSRRCSVYWIPMHNGLTCPGSFYSMRFEAGAFRLERSVLKRYDYLLTFQCAIGTRQLLQDLNILLDHASSNHLHEGPAL